jgi:hypothetical protein
MASVAVPFLEGVAARVLAGMGVGAVGAAAVDNARKRQKEAEKATSLPIARVDVCSEDNSKCKDCPPDKGAPFPRNTNGWSHESIDYQKRIAQMPPAPTGFLIEWEFRNVKFDGFDAAQCLLKESKAKYDNFFDNDGAPRYWWTGDEDIQKEAVSQSSAAKPMPPVQLRWYFMTPKMYRYCSQMFVAMDLEIETVFQP